MNYKPDYYRISVRERKTKTKNILMNDVLVFRLYADGSGKILSRNGEKTHDDYMAPYIVNAWLHTVQKTHPDPNWDVMIETLTAEELFLELL